MKQNIYLKNTTKYGRFPYYMNKIKLLEDIDKLNGENHQPFRLPAPNIYAINFSLFEFN